MKAKIGWYTLSAMVIGISAALFVQRQPLAGLRAQVDLARSHGGELARLRNARRELERAQPTAAELENLRADRVALLRLRKELAISKINADVMTRPEPSKPSLSLTHAKRREVNSWTNAGRASPAATLETVLWAAVGGNVETLAASISLDPNARKKAEEILNRLPTEVRAQYASAESLVALFTAREVPTSGSMQIIAEEIRNENEAVVGWDFLAESGESSSDNPGKRPAVLRPRLFKLRRDGENWKLVVPAHAVEKYGALLTGAQAPAGGAK